MLEVGAKREPDRTNAMRWTRFTVLLIARAKRSIGMRTAGRKVRARLAPAHMSISLPGSSMQPLAQHSNTTGYVVFDGPIETGFPDD